MLALHFPAQQTACGEFERLASAGELTHLADQLARFERANPITLSGLLMQ